MRVLITGVGDAFTSRHFGSSALIEGPEGFVMIDCPDLVHRALREATSAADWNVGANEIDDIILTHLHGDHCNGLESFGFLRRLRRLHDDRLDRPRIHTAAPVADRLWERLAPAMDGAFDGGAPSTLESYFDVRRMEPAGAAGGDDGATIAGLGVRCRFTEHPVPTIGLLIEHGGRVLGWSGDTAYEPAHIEWLRGADVIVHEANEGPAHTRIEALNALPDDLRARMRLIHLPDDFDPSCTDIRPLGEGEVLEV